MSGQIRKKNANVVVIKEQQMSPEDLMDGLLTGDVEAAAVLFDRYGAMVNHLVWRLMGPDSEHDDVVQNVFSTALSSIAKLKDPNAMGQWISGIAVNTFRREIRTRKYRRLLFEPMEAAKDLHVEDNADSKVIGHRFYRLISKLNPDLQIVFVLRFVEKMTVSQIAATTNCSTSTVKRRLHTARESFLKCASSDYFWASYIEEHSNDD